MKYFFINAKWLFILCLPALFLTASIGWAVNNQWLYEYGFQKYNVSDTTGLTEAELNEVTEGLTGYFNSDQEYIDLNVSADGDSIFNQREIIHLKDVKELIRLDYRVFLLTLLYALTYAGIVFFWQKRKYWRQLVWGMIGGSSLTLAVMLIFGLGTLFDFDWLFLQFHLISFANEFWLLDPAKDYLIMLFPQGFWYDAALLCVITTLILAITVGGMGGLFWRFVEDKKGISVG